MDLTTTYLGLNLAHPIIPGASPLCDDLDGVRRLEDAGAPMLTLRSLFEEQIVAEQMTTHMAEEGPADSYPEALTYFPEPSGFVLGPHEYLEHVRRVKETVDVPVVGSLNGTTRGGWLEYGKQIEEAGADALELNVYDLPTDPSRSADSLEQETLSMVNELRGRMRIPIAVKLSPFFTALPHFVFRLAGSGAEAVVLFNRLYQPDIDPENLELDRHIELSTRGELLLRLRWLAILSGQLDMQFAASGGVYTAEDVVKAVMSGAHGVQVVSALLRYGPTHLQTLRDELAAWLEQNEHESIAAMRGNMNMARCPDSEGYERANYMEILQSWRPHMRF